LHLFPLKESNWQLKVTTCSDIVNSGIENVWKIILAYLNLTKENNYFEERRNNQREFWVLQTINEQLKQQFYNEPKVKKELKKVLELVQKHLCCD